MKFKRKYLIPRVEPVTISIPFTRGNEDVERAELRNSAVTRLLIDRDTYIHVLIPFADCGRDELVAHLPELIGISVILNVQTGEVTINVAPEAAYQVTAAEISVLEKQAEPA